MLLLVVPLITFEADARGGGGGHGGGHGGGGHGGGHGGFGGHRGGAGFRAAHVGRAHVGRAHVGRAHIAGRSVGGTRSQRAGGAARRRGSAARATGSPPRRPTRSGAPRHAWATPVAGCSATAPSPTSHCNRNSGRRDSTARSSVRLGRGGVAASSSAGSDRCSGPTPITTCSITFTGRMPMTTSGPMPTTMSTTASTALTPITAPTAFLAGAAVA